MPADTTTGRPLTFTYLGRPAALNINAMSKRRAGDRPSARPAPVRRRQRGRPGRPLQQELYASAQRELNAGRGAEPDRAIEQIYRAP